MVHSTFFWPTKLVPGLVHPLELSGGIPRNKPICHIINFLGSVFCRTRRRVLAPFEGHVSRRPTWGNVNIFISKCTERNFVHLKWYLAERHNTLISEGGVRHYWVYWNNKKSEKRRPNFGKAGFGTRILLDHKMANIRQFEKNKNGKFIRILRQINLWPS